MPFNAYTLLFLHLTNDFVLLEVWTQAKVAYSILGMTRQPSEWSDTYFKTSKMLPALSHIFRRVKQSCCQQ